MNDTPGKGSGYSGSCLCGQVRYQVVQSIGIFQYCHCSRCRKHTGSLCASNILVKPQHFRWLAGADLVASYQPPHTRYFATAFCRQCGSSLPWQNKPATVVVIPAGTLDDPPDVRVQQNIYFASRADWYVNPTDLPAFDQLPQKQR